MFTHFEWQLALPVFVVALIGTGLVRRYALKRLLDTPNARSSHTQPVPRGGGAALAIAFLLGIVILWYAQALSTQLMATFVVGGGIIAAIGFLDDHRPVPARARFAIHLLAAIAAVTWIGPVIQVQLGANAISLPAPFAWTASVLGVVWLINLYNFMDGIDGIAASEATLVTLAASMLLGPTAVPGAILMAAASLGFLLHNWAPARIFMGDVGSGFIGYCLAVMLLASAQTSAVAVWVWLTLLATFWVDATVTLARRLLQGKRWYVAHRSHAYQHLARRFNSHAKATSSYAAVTLFLAVTALLPTIWPSQAAWITAIVSLTLVACALALRAGLDDPGSPSG